jgi:TP901 family phage tail tape measure protein
MEEARVKVTLNGEEAQRELDQINNRIAHLIELKKKAEAEGDVKGWKKISTELSKAESQAKKLEKQAFDVEKVLKNINGASIEELDVALRKATADLKKMSQADAGFSAQKQKVTELKNKLNELNDTRSPWQKLSSGFNKYIGIAAAGVASVAAFIYKMNQAVEVTNAFEDKMANLSAITGLTGSNLEWLGEKAKEMSTSTLEGGINITKSADDIVDAFTKMGSARPELLKNKEALAQVTEQALILAVAGKLDLETSISAVAAAMNQFNLDASQSTRVINTLAAGSLEGSAEISDLTGSLKNVGTVAADSNMSLEQTVAALEVLAEKQLKGEEAGTKLRGVLLKMKDAGVGYASGSFVMRDAIEDINTKLAGMGSNLEKDAYKAKVFGIENITAGNILLQNVETYDQLTVAVTGTNVAMTQAEKNTATNVALIAQAKNEFHNASIELGKNLSPAMTSFYQIAGKVAGALSNMIKKSQVELLEEEGRAVNSLATELASSNTPLQRRKEILEELKTISPKITEGLSAENLNYQTLTENIAAYNEELSNRILLENLSDEEKKYAAKVAKQKQQLGNYKVDMLNIISETDKGIALSSLSMEEKITKTLEILKSKAAGELSVFDGVIDDYRNKEAIALARLEMLITLTAEAQEKLNSAESNEADFAERIRQLKEILGLTKKINQLKTNPTPTTPTQTSSTGPTSSQVDPFAIDSEEPLKYEEWLRSMVDADSLAFAEKKRTQNEWTAFLEEKVQQQIDIKARELQFEKEAAAAEEELKLSKIEAISQIAGALSDMFEQGSAAQIAFFAIEKAAAIAMVWLNYAKEKAANNAYAATMGPFGVPYAAAMNAKALINAGANTAIIAAQAIAQVSQGKKSNQYASGKYPVLGADDGRMYDANYAGRPKTGIYSGPQIGLFNEDPSRPELVVDGRTTRQLMINYPAVYRGIRQLAAGGSPQFADGKYPSLTESASSLQGSDNILSLLSGRSSAVDNKQNEVLMKLAVAVDRLVKKELVVYTELVKKDLDTLENIDKNRGL